MKTTPNLKTRIETQLMGGQSICAVLLCLLTMTSGRAQDHWVLHHFNGLDGNAPRSLLHSNGTLFGTTAWGGSSNCGTVFKLDTDGSNFMVLKEFTGRDGAYPSGALVLSGPTLYGRTSEGGISNRGTVFKINTDGTGFTTLREFTDSDVANAPRNLTLAGETLYGIAYNGGSSNRGAICKLNTDGSEFAVIKNFTDPVEGGAGYSEGCLPGALLAVSGTTLYGSTVGGSSAGEGGIFKINTDGTSYSVIKQGNFEDGGHFMGGVIADGDTLYGASPWGGGGIGAIFRLNTDGSGFSILRSCHPYEIYMASSLSMAVSGKWLWGVSYQSSLGNFVFILRTNGSHFSLLKRFNAAEGVPVGLVMSGHTLYGVTSSGGHSNRGTVFGLSLLPPAILQPPPSQTAEAGDTVRFSAQAVGAQPLGYKWVLDDTHVLSGSTNKLLRLTNVQPAQAGSYTVVVSNLFGMATSPPATLNVIAPVSRNRVPGIHLQGETGSVLHVDYVNDFSLEPNWLPLHTVSLTSTSQFSFDVTTPLPVQRFYRAWQTGPSDLIPALNLYLIPAITLTGNLGDTVRVDGINAMGPTDAWFTLDTVMLTNTSQLYFDVSSLGQPKRLYRLTPLAQE